MDRVAGVYPLFGLKWCMILLNEFVLLITVTGGIAIIVPQLLVTASVIMVIGIVGLLMVLQV